MIKNRNIINKKLIYNGKPVKLVVATCG